VARKHYKLSSDMISQQIQRWSTHELWPEKILCVCVCVQHLVTSLQNRSYETSGQTISRNN